MEEEEEEALGEEVEEVVEQPGSISREVYNVVKCYFGIPGRTLLCEELWDCVGSSSSGSSGSLSVSGSEGTEESLSSILSLSLPVICPQRFLIEKI